MPAIFTPTTGTAVQYDDSCPPDGFRHAAQAGDFEAFRGTADWLRDRGQPANPDNPIDQPSDEERAYYVEVARYELEVLHAEARKMRRLLQLLQPTFNYSPQIDPPRLSVGAIQQLLTQHGLPAQVLHTERWVREISQYDYQIRASLSPDDDLTGQSRRALGEPLTIVPTEAAEAAGWRRVTTYLLRCSTDGVEELTTRRQLTEFVKLSFPRARILVEFANLWDTEAGYRGFCELGII